MITLSPEEIQKLVDDTLLEDVGSGDLTAGLIPEMAELNVNLLCREAAVICGQAYFNAVFATVDSNVKVIWHLAEGEHSTVDQIICSIKGNARSILTAERGALNLLQTLSGTATTTYTYTALIADLNTRMLDTRKTIPGLRRAQKYACTVGGGYNHRVGLYDGVLIKENHIAAAGSITQAVKAALAVTAKGTLLEVEVEHIEGMLEAIDAGASRILLDNFSLDELSQAVKINAGRAELEASGDVTHETLRAIALTGVDFVSSGALTKHLRAVDFSLRFIEQ